MKGANFSLNILIPLYITYTCIIGIMYSMNMFNNADTVVVSVFMFSSMLILMTTGLPIAFCLATIAIITAWLFEPGLIHMVLFQFKSFTLESGKTLICIPLFIFMGFILHNSGIAKDLFDAVYLWAGSLRGGLGMGTVIICAIMAAMIGVSSAATLSMGIIAVPAMLEKKYDKKMATGIVQAGGALGFLIPPSIMMIMYAFVAQESVGRLFAAGLIPGMMLAAMYMLYIWIKATIQPEIAPAIPIENKASIAEKLASLRYLILPCCIIFAVLGCIFTGITSPTEAAALGATGAIVSALIRRNMSFAKFKEALMRTLSLSGFNAYLIIGAMSFSSIYSGLGASTMIKSSLASMNVSPLVVVLLMQLSFFMLGMFLDDIAILFLCMPIYVPIIKTFGLDPVWFAVLYVMNMQMAYITPPYGLNLFYMKAVAPKEITLNDIYRSITPFLGIQAIALVILLVIPQIALWLPGYIFDYLQMFSHPDMLFSNLNAITKYPDLYKVLIDNPQMLFDAGNMVNIASNTEVADILFSNQNFVSFLLESPNFISMIEKNDWLVQIPSMHDFLTHQPLFIEENQTIKIFLEK